MLNSQVKDCFYKVKLNNRKKVSSIKVVYKVLFKNGIEDVIEQVASEEDITGINALIIESFQENQSGVVTFGDGTKEGSFIRIDDVSRVTLEVLE